MSPYGPNRITVTKEENAMKLKNIAAALALSTVTALPAVAADKAPSTDNEKLGYSLGAMLGKRIKADFSDIDVNMVISGMRDAISGKDLALDQNQMQAAIQTAQKAAAEKAHAKMKEMAQKNSEAGKAFLKENSQKSGVKTTESGLQYKVIKEGKGVKPMADAEVTVNYEGKLLDGTVFDSSFARKQPASFRVGQVIPGWVEALQMMPEGSSYELYIPSDLAYGPGGAPQGSIGPNETLIFKVDLIKVNNPEKKAEEKAKK